MVNLHGLFVCACVYWCVCVGECVLVSVCAHVYTVYMYVYVCTYTYNLCSMRIHMFTQIYIYI